jgi:hypothetical protein
MDRPHQYAELATAFTDLGCMDYHVWVHMVNKHGVNMQSGHKNELLQHMFHATRYINNTAILHGGAHSSVVG